MKKMLSIALLSALAFLPACDSAKKEEASEATSSPAGMPVAASGEVLLTIDGKPAISVSEFKQFYEQLLDQQPQLKSFAAFMPDLKEQVFESMASYKLIEKWAQDKQIEQSKEYQKELEAQLSDIKKKLAITYFQKENPVNVSDADVKKFYETNKDTMYLMQPEGVAAVGVSFDSESAARNFLTKAQQPGADLAKLAKELNLNARNFGRVNAKSQQVEQKLREKILAVKTFPSVHLIPVDKTFWVIQAASKDQGKHYPFEQAKEDARNRLTAEKMGEVFTREIAKLKGKYAVVENKKYFEQQKEDLQKKAQTEAGKKPGVV
jgi:hypothetical protein